MSDTNWYHPGFAALFIPLYNFVFILLVESFRRTKFTQWIFFVLFPIIYTPLWTICDTLNPPGMIKAWSVVFGCWIMYALRFHHEWIVRNHPKTFNALIWISGVTVAINILEAVLWELYETYYYEETHNLAFPGNPLAGIILIITMSHPKILFIRDFATDKTLSTSSTTDTNTNINDNTHNSTLNEKKETRVVAILDNKVSNMIEKCLSGCKSKMRRLLIGKMRAIATQMTVQSVSTTLSMNSSVQTATGSGTTTPNPHNGNTTPVPPSIASVNLSLPGAGDRDSVSSSDNVNVNNISGDNVTIRDRMYNTKMKLPVIDYDFGILWVLVYTIWNMIFGYNIQCIEPIPGFSLHLGIPLFFILFYCDSGEWIELRAYSLWLWLFVDGFCFNLDETIPFFELIECDQVGARLWIIQLLSIISFVFGMIVLIDQIYSQIKYNKQIASNEKSNKESDDARYHSFVQFLVNKCF